MQIPTLADRHLQCQRPPGPVVMHQDWTNLLFLHWEIPSEILREGLPKGLHLDLFAGKSYLGLVPFFMRNVRPRYFPCVPGISNFLEMNLRTYVHDDEGRPGVWFYSLDANQALAVGLARRLFRLPYQHAEMKAHLTSGGWIDYQSKRQWTRVQSRFLYRGRGQPQAANPGTLEYFFLERYLLFALSSDGLRRGRVYHSPYPLQSAEVEVWDDKIFLLNGFDSPGRPPDHCHFSTGVEVDIYPLS